MTVQTFTDERQAIELRFAEIIDTHEVPVQYDNVQFLKKGDEVIQKENQVPFWMRLAIIPADMTQVEVGNSRSRISGVVVISIFTKENSGSNTHASLVDQAYKVFHGQLFEGVQCRDTSVTRVPPSDGWFQTNLATEYYWDKCRT